MPECTNELLPSWEQSYHREIVFGVVAQASFAQANFGQFDTEAQPYGSRELTNTVPSTPAQTPPPSTYTPSMSSPSLSISLGFAGLTSPPETKGHVSSQVADVNYGESSGPNNRPYVEPSP
ncbi:hypothetical protein N7G274_010807 [Stereocaulon virgatum]|uniref:Uncharacterized protein n=1 Tax=Stereocaulon virgatum TaxID=373712 RepID=A0ABR3ZSV7_9LECA